MIGQGFFQSLIPVLGGCTTSVVQSAPGLTLPSAADEGNLIIIATYFSSSGSPPIFNDFSDIGDPDLPGVAILRTYAKFAEGGEQIFTDDGESTIYYSYVFEISSATGVASSNYVYANGSVPSMYPSFGSVSALYIVASNNGVGGSPDYYSWVGDLEYFGNGIDWGHTSNYDTDPSMDGGGIASGLVKSVVIALECGGGG